jgi:type IV secretion system protein VirB4
LLLIDSLIEDGIALQHDGSYLAAWEFRGPDLASSTAEHINALTARISSALCLGTGWMVQSDVVRTRATGYLGGGNQWSGAVFDLVEEERRNQFAQGEHYESRYYISLTYLPPKSPEEKAIRWIATGRPNIDPGEHLAEFKSKVQAFENVLTQLNARRLKRVDVEVSPGYPPVACDELLAYIHECATGKHHRIRLPKFPIGLNDLMGSVGIGTVPDKIGSQFFGVVSVDGFPDETVPGILWELDKLTLPYRWSTRAIMQDSVEAKSQLQADVNYWKSAIIGIWARVTGRQHTATPNLDAVKMQGDATDALSKASGNKVQIGHYTGTVLLMDPEERRLKESIRRVQAALQSAGFVARIDEGNAFEVYLGSIPGDGYSNVRRSRVTTENIADMLPLTAPWLGEATNPSDKFPPNTPPLLRAITTGGAPFNLNLHVRDVGHTLVLGPSGAGKSTMLGFEMLSWLRYPDAQVICFDWDYSQQVLTWAVVGDHYDLMDDEGLGFCPLGILESEQDRAWAGQYIAKLCALGGMVVTSKEQNLIDAAVRQLARRERHRTLSNFCDAVQSSEIREALKYYTVKGPAGRLLDCDSDSLGAMSNRFTTFELRQLIESRDQKTILPVLFYLFHRAIRRLDGSPTLIVIDEGWSWLDFEMLRREFGMWLLTTRRRNAAVLMATQEISHIAECDISSTIRNQTATKIWLPNPEAPTQAEAYREFGLNSAEIEMISMAEPKREYYVTSAMGRRMIDLVLGKVALAFVGTNSVPDRKRVRKLMAEYPDTWEAEWLRFKGLDAWACRLEEMLGINEEAKCVNA